MIDLKALKEIKDKGWDYKCCGGSETCANNKSKRFIDHIQHLALTDTDKFRDELFCYIESVETDRETKEWQVKCAFLEAEVKRLRHAVEQAAECDNCAHCRLFAKEALTPTKTGKD